MLNKVLSHTTKLSDYVQGTRVLEDMYSCLDILELSYVAMGLLIMLSRARGKSLQATQ